MAKKKIGEIVAEELQSVLQEEGLELVEVTPGIDKQTQVLDLLPFPVKDATC